MDSRSRPPFLTSSHVEQGNTGQWAAGILDISVFVWLFLCVEHVCRAADAVRIGFDEASRSMSGERGCGEVPLFGPLLGGSSAHRRTIQSIHSLKE